ncbi:MAG TPA: DUF4199 domain-containing protein [Caulobacteraceae bacterium]|nr:DUF4199 domain-containing protein [Caulobacteraceae bacterium]
MLRQILTYGAVAGLIVGVPMFAMTLTVGHLPMPWGMVVGYLVMLIALSAVFLGVKRRRDRDLGGVIRFWPALGMGLAISLVASILYVLSWEAATAISGLDFAAEYGETMLAQKRAEGASAAELAEMSAELQAWSVQYQNPLFRLPMTFSEIFPVGVLVSLITAALLRNSRFMPAR